MAGLVPAIHVFGKASRSKTWMPATSAGMTSQTMRTFVLIRRSGLVQGRCVKPHGAISPMCFLRLSNGFGPAPCAGAIVFTSRLFAVMMR
jgi:hypothetical protein